MIYGTRNILRVTLGTAKKKPTLLTNKNKKQGEQYIYSGALKFHIKFQNLSSNITQLETNFFALACKRPNLQQYFFINLTFKIYLF